MCDTCSCVFTVHCRFAQSGQEIEITYMPFGDEQMVKLWYLPTTEYYSAARESCLASESRE